MDNEKTLNLEPNVLNKDDEKYQPQFHPGNDFCLLSRPATKSSKSRERPKKGDILGVAVGDEDNEDIFGQSSRSEFSSRKMLHNHQNVDTSQMHFLTESQNPVYRPETESDEPE